MGAGALFFVLSDMMRESRISEARPFAGAHPDRRQDADRALVQGALDARAGGDICL